MNLFKKFLILSIFLTSVSPAFSIEEVDTLKPIELKVDEPLNFNIEKSQKTNINPTTKKQNPLNLFSNKGYEFESGIIKNVKFNTFVRMDYDIHAGDAETNTSFFKFRSTEFTLTTLFRDNKTKFDVSYDILREIPEYDNNFFQKFSNITLDYAFNKNQTLRLGQARTPIGLEGERSTNQLKFFNRAMIAKNYGDARSMGIRNIANYKYFEYDIGLFDSSRYINKLFNGFEFAGNIAIKPLAKYGDKYGELKIGTSIDVGNADTSYTVFNAYSQYQYKNFYWDFEYGKSHGTGGKLIKQMDSSGFFTTLGYKVTDNVEILGRYDFFHNETSEKYQQELTAGLNYYIYNYSKLMCNYVCAFDSSRKTPSHKIYLGWNVNTNDFVDKFLDFYKERL